MLLITGRCRKLIIDQKKKISVNEMKAQLSDTTDIVKSLHLAPQTKRFMYLIEREEVKKLFALPGRPIYAGPLLRVITRKSLSFILNNVYTFLFRLIGL